MSSFAAAAVTPPARSRRASRSLARARHALGAGGRFCQPVRSFAATCCSTCAVPASVCPGARCTKSTMRMSERLAIARLTAAADWTVDLAPEFDGHLRLRCEAVERAGGRLLGPSSGLVALAADKQATAEHLAERGVPAAHGISLPAGQTVPRRFCLSGRAQAAVRRRLARHPLACRGEACWEHPGRVPGPARAISVRAPPSAWRSCAVRVRRIERSVPLVPCSQAIDAAGDFAYSGGSLPLAPALAARAVALATRAIAHVGRSAGLFGHRLWCWATKRRGPTTW